MSALDDICRRVADCRSYNFGMRNADKLAHEDAPRLLAALDAVLSLANVAETHGLHGAGFRMIPSDQLRAAINDALEATS